MAALLRTELGVVCGSCDFLNAPGAVKCTSCGQPTESTAAAKAPAEKEKTDKQPALQVVPGGAAPAAPAAEGSGTFPPGLKRATTGSTPAHPAEQSGRSAPSSGPSRPKFESSAPPPATAAAAPKFGLTVLAGPTRGQRFRLAATGAQVGRSKGVVLFPDDPFVSPLHATFVVRDGRLFVRDDESTSGTFVSVAGQETIPPDSYFCAGIRLFHYVGALEPAPPFVPGKLQIYGAPVPPSQVHYCIEEILLGGRPGRAVITAGPILTIGQGKCDLSYANDDGLAARHCEVSPMPTGAMIRDLSGGLGTFVRIAGERALKPGDRLRIGQQTLQVELLT